MSTALEFLWHGGNTERFHTVPTIRPDLVGHHSYNVACIIMVLRPDAPAKLLRAALKHDSAEHIVGDMPSPTKRELPDYPDGALDMWDNIELGARTFREAFGALEERTARTHGIYGEDLGDEEEWLLKLADALDGMRYCIQERGMGNGHPKLVEAFTNFRTYCTTLLFGPEPEAILQFATPVAHAEKADVDLFKYMVGEWHHVHDS
jgi:5'-deoxynucleotidase YfbR-like HD superfamily hydrolase